MFTIDIQEGMLEKLRSMLEDEDEGACVRLREYKMGGGCHSHIILGLSFEEMDDDEDEKIVMDGIPFIAERDFLLKYGRSFSLGFNEDRQVTLTPVSTEK